MRVLTAAEIQFVAGGDDPNEVAPVIVQGHAPSDNPIGWLQPFAPIFSGIAGAARSVVGALTATGGTDAAATTAVTAGVASAGAGVLVTGVAGVAFGAATQKGADVNTAIGHYATAFNSYNPQIDR